MPERDLYFWIKFGKRKDMESLMTSGTLFMQRLSKFREIEEQERGDPDDGIDHSLQPNQTQLLINGETINGVVGPIRIIENTSVDPLAYCLYAFTSDHLKTIGNNYIDKRCLEFGDTAVIIKGADFYERIKTKCDKIKAEIEGKLVSYVDRSYHGKMGSFKKYSNFEHQSEYRFVLNSSIKDENYKFDIGPINDIAELHPADKINELIQIA